MNQQNHFEYGQIVKIKDDSPAEYNPGVIGSICGMKMIDSASLAQRFNAAIGEWLYIVEFSNGNSIELPERFLKKIEL